MTGNKDAIIIRFTSTRNEVASWIKSTVNESRFGSGIIKAVFDIPPVNRVPGPVLADAITMVLEEYAINPPMEVIDKIRRDVDDSFSFYVLGKDPELTPREVRIDNSPEIGIMVIKGVEPVDGENSRIEFFFDHTVRAGKVMADGSIDFRAINRFPQAREGDHLLRVYDATAGVYGTDVYGAPLPPVSGSPHPASIDEESLRKKEGVDEEKRRAFSDWFALRSGIIVCSFINDERKEEFLEEISIRNQLVVKNIDFTTGNITGDDNTFRCAADLVVEGDIKGQFSVQIDGSLEVMGSVEGENVEVSEAVKASFIRNTIRSGKEVEVGAALSASITAAESVTVLREIADCSVSARNVFFRGRGDGLLCGRVIISAWYVEAVNVMVRNRLEINLGEELLEQMDNVVRQIADMELNLEGKEAAFRDLAGALGEKIKKLPVINDKRYFETLNRLKKIASVFLRGEIGPDKVRAALEAISAGEIFNLKGIVTLMFNLADMQDKITYARNQHDGMVAGKALLEKDMSSMGVRLSGKLFPAGQVLVRCGEKKALFESSTPDGKEDISIVLRYDQDYGLVAQDGL